MNTKPIYKKGDKVKIVKYGHLIWQNKKFPQPKLSFPVYQENKDIRWIDMLPELVGQEGLVHQVSMVQGMPQYAINEIKAKYAWYNEDQLKII